MRVAPLLLFVPCLGCGTDAASGPGQPPDIVVVCIDTLRADHTSLHGYERATTPALERMAAEGLWLTHHLANSSWTKPSVASMLTGLPPTTHGSRTGQFVHPSSGRDARPEIEVLSERLFTLPEVLSEHGYFTCAHVTNYNMVARFGYAQGYDEYRFEDDATDERVVHRSDQEAIEFAKQRLRTHQGPVFAWVHLMSVHQYASPPTGRLFRSRARSPVAGGAVASQRLEPYEWVEQAVDDYDDAVRACDQLVGELWDWMRVNRPNSILIVTSDHGEEFGEHDGFEHGSTLYGEQLHVPLVIAGAGVPAQRMDELTDSLDLFPTVLSLAGIELEDQRLPGRALIENGATTGGKRLSFAEQHARGPWRRVSAVGLAQADAGKLIRSWRKLDGSEEVQYFTDAFGGELANEYASGDPETMRALWQALEAYQTEAAAEFDRRVGTRVTTTLDASEVDVFQGLGYADDFEGSGSDGER